MPVEELRCEEKEEGIPSVKKRGQWGNKAEFILSCLGYCIGLGNVWRFPYLCYRNGGGAFLVPYLLMLTLCGIPLYFMEIALGQFSSTGCISIFRMTPLFKGAGFAVVLVNFICTSYYNVVISYPLYFLPMSFRDPLPWANCDNSWNTPACLKHGEDGGAHHYNTTSNSTVRMKTPADEFFHNGILQISEGIDKPGGIVWELVLCDFLSWVMVYLCIINGVKSVGKVVYFTATFPFVILFILLIRGVTLPGAIDGIRFYIYPDWEQLKNVKVWTDAAVQIFFSLGPGWGGIVNIASYNNFHNNMKWEAVFIPVTNCGTSIFAGFVVFSVLGYMSHMTGVPVSQVATEGAGLAFIAYPEAISLMPIPQLWSVLFFLMLYVLGMGSCFVQIEAIIGSITDEVPTWRRHKKYLSLFACFAMFLLSLSCVTNGGMYVLQLLDAYAASIAVILICTVEVFCVGWAYGADTFTRDVEFMIQRSIPSVWKICWKYVTLIVLVSIFITTVIFNVRVTYNGIEYPDWAVAIGWLSAVASMLCIPAYVVYKLLVTPGSLYERLAINLRPSEEWGPEDEETRAAWQGLIAKDQNR